MQKIYCYVDETGQDTKGDFFLVSVIIAKQERDGLIEQLEEIERLTRKRRRKWVNARDEARVAYIRAVLSHPAFKGKLSYALYQNTTDYLAFTIRATAEAIKVSVVGEYRATVFIDGLPRTHIHQVGTELRRLQISTRKVRGVRDEQANALIRLADALCGFVRAALSGREDLSLLLKQAKEQAYLRKL